MHNIIMSRAHQEEMNTNQNLYQGYVELYHNGLFHIKSTALRCAVELGIPDAIHRRGGAATVSDFAVDTSIHPAKLPCLRRLMRMLTVSGIFAVDHQLAPPSDDDEGETVYKLTPISRLLVDDDDDGASSPRRGGMSAMLCLLARPVLRPGSVVQRCRGRDALRGGARGAHLEPDEERRLVQRGPE
jgi:hypothetical protein